MVKVRNLLRRMRVFNLEHPHFTSTQGENGLGKPETLTMLAHEVRELPEEVLECREVKAALKPKKGRPTLRVVG